MNNIQVYIINMANRLDRKTHMTSLINELGFKNYNFVIPFKADLDTKQKYETIIKRKSTLPLSKISHNMTYLNILNTAKEDKIIIFEDDVIMTKPINIVKKELYYIYYNVPLESDMIYLEMCYENCNFKENEGFRKLENPLCAASIYYPNRNKRYNLVNELINSKNFYKEAIDNMYRELIKSEKIQAYMYSILFIQDNKYGSDLEGSTGYNEKIKPMLPICWNYHKTIKYITGTDSEKNIKNMYLEDYYNQITIVILILLSLILIFFHI